MPARNFLPWYLAVVSVLTYSASAICAECGDDLIPSTAFVQASVGHQSTRAYIAGVTWDWNLIKRPSTASRDASTFGVGVYG